MLTLVVTVLADPDRPKHEPPYHVEDAVGVEDVEGEYFTGESRVGWHGLVGWMWWRVEGRESTCFIPYHEAARL